MSNEVLFEKVGRKAYITLNRPKKLNALTLDMYKDISRILDEIDLDDTIRVVILRGENHVFSAGWDLGLAENLTVFQERNKILKICNANRWKIWNSTKIFIAQVERYALGGAFELILPCDYIIAAEDAIVGEPELQFGEPPAYLMVPWLTDLRTAKKLLLTGEKITAKEAAEYHLITQAVPKEKLEETVEQLAKKLMAGFGAGVAWQKQGINRSYEMMGMRTAIDNFVDTGLFFKLMKDEEILEFNRIVNEQGLKAAMAWRDANLADGQ